MNRTKIQSLLNAGVANLWPWMAAALVSAIATSFIQSQMNLFALVPLGAPLTFSA